MESAFQRSYGEFDIGTGPTRPDAFIMKTGRVEPKVYTSPEWFEAERALFRRTWLRVGQANEIPNPGDWIVREVEIAPASILITRGKDSRIRAFHNVCTHRNLKLVWDDKGNSNQFVCHYHAWCFRNDGGLQAIPGRRHFPDVDIADSGLTPIAAEVFGGFIFINLDPNPSQTLRTFLGGVADLLQDAPMAEYQFSFRLSGLLKANWKGGLEAASEGYHVPSLHKDSAKEMACSQERPLNDPISEQFLGPHRRFSIPRNLDFRLNPNRPVQNFVYATVPQNVIKSAGAHGEPGGKFVQPGINPTKAPDWGLDIVSIFPNLQLNLALNGFWTMQYWPIAVDSFRWSAEWFHLRGPASRTQEFAVASTAAMVRDISAEDTDSIEKQYQALKSQARPYIQFGEQEMMCRHEMAVLKALIEPKVKAHLKGFAAAR